MPGRASTHGSWLNIPHVTHNDEADITTLEPFRNSVDDEAKKDKAKPYRVSLLPFLMRAAVGSLRAFPRRSQTCVDSFSDVREISQATCRSDADQWAPAQPARIYTCSMHPQIRRSEPGSCPICGMALEPLQPVIETGPGPELRDMTSRFWIGAALALPIVALDMAADVHALGLQRVVSPIASMWIQLVLATPVVLWTGWPLLKRASSSVRRRSLNMVLAP